MGGYDIYVTLARGACDTYVTLERGGCDTYVTHMSQTGSQQEAAMVCARVKAFAHKAALWWV
jgi:hypothetical protein